MKFEANINSDSPNSAAQCQNQVPLCGTCEYGEPTFKRNRGEDRRANPLVETGNADCSRPEYKRRKTYPVKNNRTECPHYKKRQYKRGETGANG